MIDALRAATALIITWHHFALYGPLSDWAQPLAGKLLYFFKQHGRATQIFFVIGGYVLARSLSKRNWNIRRVARFVGQRYLRLGLPYVGAIALAIAACAFGREWLPPQVIGDPFTWPRLFAHLVFLQDILGYESFSAGLWFVCINFQLSLVFVAMLWLRDVVSPSDFKAGAGGEPPSRQSPPAESTPHTPRGTTGNLREERRSHAGEFLFSLIGWSLAAAALFYFNLDEQRWGKWFIYFFGHFYLGVIVHQALKGPRTQWLFWLYVAMVGAALCFTWRWRLMTTLACGFVLFLGGKVGFMDTWPKSRVISYFGRTSYSLFLVHFPVLLVVATIWTQLHWQSPRQAVAGLAVAFVLSLAVSDLFFRAVEKPADRLSRRFS